VEAAVDSQRAKENRGTLKEVLTKGLPMLEQLQAKVNSKDKKRW
jgi:hypothetical protein